MSFWGSITGSDALKDAAKIQAKATREAVAAQTSAGERAEGYYQPYRAGGMTAWDKLMQIAGLKGVDAQEAAYDDFRESPGVAFRRDQGVQAIDRSQAARGKLLSGNTLIDLDRFGQGLAEQSFGDYKGDLRYLSDRGFDATGSSAGARLNTGANIANLTMEGGRTQADLAMRQGEILPNLLTGIASIGGDIFGRYLEGRTKTASPYARRPAGGVYSYGGPR